MRQGQASSAPVPGGCWPTEDQTLLLRAALLGGDEARAAWVRWRAANSPDTTDRGSIRLLPLAYRNLGPAGLSAPDANKLKGAYRATWLGNQVLFQRTAEGLTALHEVGIRTMLLKGVALAVTHYGDAGVRPMDDADVLVPAADADRALAALARAGWSTEPDASGLELRTGHAVPLHDRSGRSLDLHRYALAQAATDDHFWSASVEIELLGVPTRALCPADQLLHVAVHGASWGAVPPVRWLADAAAIERSSGPGLDWDRLVAEATRRRVTVSLAAALEHLAEAVRFPVPAGVLAQLHAAPKGRFERWTHRAATRPVGGGSWAPVILDQYARTARLDPSVRLVPFLQEHFGARTRRQLAGRVARKTIQVGFTQTALRVAPGRVRRCRSCGGAVVRLGPDGLCESCAPAAGKRRGLA